MNAFFDFIFDLTRLKCYAYVMLLLAAAMYYVTGRLIYYHYRRDSSYNRYLAVKIFCGLFGIVAKVTMIFALILLFLEWYNAR